MCGVAGVKLSPKVSQYATTLIQEMLSRLQHRGQESAGVAVATEYGITVDKNLGLVSHVSKVGNWHDLVGSTAIGHTRYSTKGKTTVKNACPMEEDSAIGRIAISYNGNLLNANNLRSELARHGFDFSTTTDTEVIIKCLVYHLRQGQNVVEAIKSCMARLHGAYSVLVLTVEGLYGFRDPYGIRPLCLGQLDGGFVMASESCALGAVGAVLLREIENGEIVSITDDGVDSDFGPRDREAMCLFELIYIARPDALIYGQNVSLARWRSGWELAYEARGYDPEHFGVVPMPNTGTPAGDGYASFGGKPILPIVVKDRFHPERTFIRPDQAGRENGLDSFSIISAYYDEFPDDVYVDDSIVRGTTKGKMVKNFRVNGAREIHLRIASPQYRFPCYLGVDTADQGELIASGRTIEEVRELLGADSLYHLSLDGLYKAIRLPQCRFCDGCLTGKYPMEIPAETILAKNSLE